MSIDYSDDYAVLEAGGFFFYYGYEYTQILETRGLMAEGYDPSDEDADRPWGFIAYGATTLFHASKEQLNVSGFAGPQECLLMGIALMVEKGIIKFEVAA